LAVIWADENQADFLYIRGPSSNSNFGRKRILMRPQCAETAFAKNVLALIFALIFSKIRIAGFHLIHPVVKTEKMSHFFSLGRNDRLAN
jgi:hypothetical protein